MIPSFMHHVLTSPTSPVLVIASSAHNACQLALMPELLQYALNPACSVSKELLHAGLARHYEADKMLKASFAIKVAIVVPGIAAIIVLAALMKHCDNKTPPGASDYTNCNVADSSAAALEWFIATLFCIYIFSIIFDLYPARYTSKHRATEPRPLMQPTDARHGKRPMIETGPIGTSANSNGLPVSNGTSLV